MIAEYTLGFIINLDLYSQLDVRWTEAIELY